MKFFKKFAAIVVVLALAFSISGCRKKVENNLPTNEAGVSLEDLAPINSNFVFSYSTLDEAQRTNLEAISEKLSLDKLWAFYEETIDEALGQSDMSYDEIKQMLGDERRFLISVAIEQLELDEELEEEEDVEIELYDVEEQIDFVLLMTVADTAKATAFLNALAADQEENILFNTEGYLTLADTGSGTHIMLLNDIMVLTPEDDALTRVIERYNGDGESLADDEAYLTALSEFETPQLGYFYLNFSNLDLDEELERGMSLYGLNVTDYQAYGISATEDGFSVTGTAQFNKKELKEYDISLDMFSGPGSYLDKKLNGENLMAYSESYNVIDGLKMTPGFDEAMENEQFEALFGMTIPEAIFSWMDKGAAFALYEGDWVIPGLTIAFDATSGLEFAKEFFMKLDAQIAGYMTMMNPGETEMLTKTTEGGVTTLSVDLNNPMFGMYGLAFPGTTPPALELSYGITDDDLVVLSLQKDFVANHGKDTVASQDSYKKALSMVDGFDGGVTYLNLENITSYTEDLFDFMYETTIAKERRTAEMLELEEEEAEAQIAEFEEEFNKAKEDVLSVLENMDFFIMANEIVSSDRVNTAGYLKLK